MVKGLFWRERGTRMTWYWGKNDIIQWKGTFLTWKRRLKKRKKSNWDKSDIIAEEWKTGAAQTEALGRFWHNAAPERDENSGNWYVYDMGERAFIGTFMTCLHFGGWWKRDRAQRKIIAQQSVATQRSTDGKAFVYATFCINFEALGQKWHEIKDVDFVPIKKMDTING